MADLSLANRPRRRAESVWRLVPWVEAMMAQSEAPRGTALSGDDHGVATVTPCFTPGTLIATPRGQIPVENLREGDAVITRDNSLQEIRWVGRRDLTGRDLMRAPRLRPVLIRQGMLGNGLPERHMLISPQHRMLLVSEQSREVFNESEVLVAAKHLVDHKGIVWAQTYGARYIHFMFDRHEVVMADGTWTESFQPDDQTLGSMGETQREEILTLFPELRKKEDRNSYAAARKALKGHQARLLVR